MTSIREELMALLTAPPVQAASHGVLAWVGRGLLVGTGLALLTWIVVRLSGRRVSPALQAALWLAVLVKFMVPVGPAWSVPLAGMAAPLANRLHGFAINKPDDPAAGSTDISWVELTADGSPVSAPAAASMTIPPPRADRRLWPLVTGATLAYVAAVVLFGAVRWWRYRRFAAMCLKLPRASAAVTEAVEQVCARLKLRRPPQVRISDSAPAPFILGALRPLLVLSTRQLENADELDAVILHEMAHLRRGDLIVRYVQWFVGTTLFFWPVVAWVNRRIDLAREHACDAWALRHGRLRPSEYARCLLRALTPDGPGRMSYCPAAMAANFKSVERRIEMILNVSPRLRGHRWLSVPVIALLAVWTGFVLTGATVADEPADGAKSEGKAVKVVVQKVAADGQTVVDEEVEEFNVEGASDGKMVVVRRVVGPVDVNGQPVERVVEVTGDAGEVGRLIRVMVNGEPCDGDGGAAAKLHAGMFAFAGHGPGQFMAMRGLDPVQFAKDHPTADADGNGEASRVEHDAFVTARALYAPDAVLAQFPRADRNTDGVLDAAEAARLVAGPAMFMHYIENANGVNGAVTATSDERIEVRVETQAATATAEAGEEEASGEAVVEVREGEPKVFVHRMGGMGGPGGAGVAGHFGLKGGLPVPPAKWVLDNVSAEPTVDEVSLYLETARLAPRLAILERHPEADLDGNGELSDEELQAFHKTMMEKVQGWMNDGHGGPGIGPGPGAGFGGPHGPGGPHVFGGLPGFGGRMFHVKVDDGQPGETVEEFTDENGNHVKRTRTVTVQDGKVEVTVKEEVQSPGEQ